MIPFIDPNFARPVFDLISIDTANSGEKDNLFVNDYFKKTYIEQYDIRD